MYMYLVVEIELVQGRQHPPDATVSSKHYHPKLLKPLEELEPIILGGGGGGEIKCIHIHVKHKTHTHII